MLYKGPDIQWVPRRLLSPGTLQGAGLTKMQDTRAQGNICIKFMFLPQVLMDFTALMDN